MRRLLAATFITGFWLAMMASLVWRHGWVGRGGSGEALPLEAVKSDWQDIQHWMRIFWKDTPIGAAFLQVREAGDEPGYRVASRSEIELAGPQGAVTVRLKAVAKLDADFHLDRFWAVATAGEIVFDASGFVLEDRLYFQFMTSQSLPVRAYWPLKQPLSLMEALRPVAARALPLEEGATYRMPAFDPIWFGQAGEAVMRVGARQIIQHGDGMVWATPVATTLGGQTTTAWIDDNRTLLAYELMNGIILERIDDNTGEMLFPHLKEAPPLPTFDVESFAYDLSLIDLSEGNAMGAAMGIVMRLLGAGK